MYTTRHLQNLVGAEVRAGENVSASLDDVAESRVVDHDCIQSADVQRALAGGSHRQEVGLLLFSFEKGSDHSDRFTTVVVGGIDAREPRLHERCGLLDA